MKPLVLAFALTLAALPAQAQDWGDLDALILPKLTTSGTAEASFWLPDNPDPAAASIALAVVYEWIEGSAGSTGIAPGFFVKQEGSWVFAGKVEGLFGQSPSDVAYGESAMSILSSLRALPVVALAASAATPSVPVRQACSLLPEHAGALAHRLPDSGRRAPELT